MAMLWNQIKLGIKVSSAIKRETRRTSQFPLLEKKFFAASKERYTGEHAVSWRAENKEFKCLEKEIKDLKAKQQKCKNNMNTDAERYVDKHPKFEVKTEHYIAVV